MTGFRPLGLAAAAFALAAAAPGPASVEADLLVRTIARGEPLSPADVAPGALPAGQARGTLRGSDLVGKEAARSLSAGMPVRQSDVLPRQLVRRGDAVAIILSDGPLTISATGRALSGGGIGETVRVVNTATGRTLDGQVSGPGRVLFSAS